MFKVTLCSVLSVFTTTVLMAKPEEADVSRKTKEMETTTVLETKAPEAEKIEKVKKPEIKGPEALKKAVKSLEEDKSEKNADEKKVEEKPDEGKKTESKDPEGKKEEGITSDIKKPESKDKEEKTQEPTSKKISKPEVNDQEVQKEETEPKEKANLSPLFIQDFNKVSFEAEQKLNRNIIIHIEKKGCPICAAQNLALTKIFSDPKNQDFIKNLIVYRIDSESNETKEFGESHASLILFMGDKKRSELLNESDPDTISNFLKVSFKPAIKEEKVEERIPATETPINEKKSIESTTEEAKPSEKKIEVDDVQKAKPSEDEKDKSVTKKTSQEQEKAGNDNSEKEKEKDKSTSAPVKSSLDILPKELPSEKEVKTKKNSKKSDV